MTGEEAIYWIENLSGSWDGQYREARDMAIAALREQGGSFQNGNDHNTVKDWPPYMDLPRERDVTDINVGSKWISVEERLPEDWLWVQVYRSANRTMDTDFRTPSRKGGWCHYNDITHWMPLPEPPKEEV